jgi:transcriptional regulator with XRE-family HTH domain
VFIASDGYPNSFVAESGGMCRRYESKGVKPSGDVLAKIANILGVTSDFLMSGSNNEQAEASLTDRELLSQFQRVEELPNDKKAIVKELLESFLLKYDIQKRMH